MNKHLQSIIEKPMDRKEFLGYIGAAFLAVVGVSGIIKAMLQHTNGSSSGGHQVADGYGVTSYGGVVKKSTPS